MKKLIIIACAITALSYLAPITGIAEPTHPNEVGLYTSPDGHGATGTYNVGIPVEVYLVLTKPMIPDQGGVPCSTIQGFECRLVFDPVPNEDLYLMSYAFPPDWINGCYAPDITLGYLDFMVAGPDDLPVTDETMVLIRFTFLNLSPTVFEVTLCPIIPPSVPGQMCYLTFDLGPPHLVAMHSISGFFDAPAFIFNGEAVSVETESFGSLKALYR
jgi:hypothetical protein